MGKARPSGRRATLGRGVAGRICARVFRTVWGPQQSGLEWQIGWGVMWAVEAVLPGDGPTLAGVKCCPSGVEKWQVDPGYPELATVLPQPSSWGFLPTIGTVNENLWSGKSSGRKGQR